jgi:bifunctional non-homologous end joining protein LigD
VARLPRARRGKVYVDYLQNGYGKLLVAPYSARPLPGAPVSMPLAWEELTPQLDPRDFSLATAPRRLAEWDGDPMRPVLGEAPDLAGALARLVETLE